MHYDKRFIFYFVLCSSLLFPSYMFGMYKALPAKENNGLYMLACLKNFVIVTAQYQAFARDISRERSKKIQELETYLDGTAYTAQDVFNTFFSDGSVPYNYFEFLDAYSQHKANIALETELFIVHSDFCDNLSAFKIVRTLFDNEIARLLRQEIDYNVCDDDGNNLVIMAAAAGSKSIIEHILVQASHPNINATNRAGEDAFITALKYGHYDIAQFLFQKNVRPNMDKEALLMCVGQCDISLQREIHKHQLQGFIHSYIK